MSKYEARPNSRGINLVPLMNDAYLRESYLSNNYIFWDNIINNTLFESGTYLGSAVLAALTKGVGEIYSIEIDKQLYDENVKNMCDVMRQNNYADCLINPNQSLFRIRDNEGNLVFKINYFFGDSCAILPQVLPQINTKLSFWLDGHVSNSEGFASTASPIAGKEPLLHELEYIKQHHIKEHNLFLDIDSPDNWNRKDEIKDFLKSINPDYTVDEVKRFYFDDPNEVIKYENFLKNEWGVEESSIQKLKDDNFWQDRLPDVWDNNVVIRAYIKE